MRRSLRIPLLALALVPVAGAPAVAPAQAARTATAACASSHQNPADAAKRQARLATLCLLNRERAARGLRPLRLDRRLSVASERHSRNMVRKDFFGHGNFVSRILRARYVTRRQAWALGENIAWGTGRLATPREIVEGWMNSPGHKANILSRRYRDVGIGIVRGGPGSSHPAAATYTTDFGRRG